MWKWCFCEVLKSFKPAEQKEMLQKLSEKLLEATDFQ